MTTYDADQESLDSLRSSLLGTERISAFRGQTADQDHARTAGLLGSLEANHGFTVIDVLPQLIGLKLTDLVFAWLRSVRPSSIRVVTDYVHCDARSWRVTVYVDKNDVIMKIEQEVQVGYGSGYDLASLLREAKTGEIARPAPDAIFHTGALSRIEFQP